MGSLQIALPPEAAVARTSSTPAESVEGITSCSYPAHPLMKRNVSAPALKHFGRQQALAKEKESLEVYVALRAFLQRAPFKHLPPSAIEFLEDAGVGHYSLVFKDRDGKLSQFDFGPSDGSDVHFDNGLIQRWLSPSPVVARRGRGVEGKIRERQVRWLISQGYVSLSRSTLLGCKSAVYHGPAVSSLQQCAPVSAS